MASERKAVLWLRGYSKQSKFAGTKQRQGSCMWLVYERGKARREKERERDQKRERDVRIVGFDLQLTTTISPSTSSIN